MVDFMVFKKCKERKERKRGKGCDFVIDSGMVGGGDVCLCDCYFLF